MHTKIIVPLDGSELAEQSLPYARLIAKSLSIPIELLGAFNVLPPALHGPGTTPDETPLSRRDCRAAFAMTVLVKPGTRETPELMVKLPPVCLVSAFSLPQYPCTPRSHIRQANSSG